MNGIKRTLADKVFSDAVREANNWKCERCGKIDYKSSTMDNAHNNSRKYRLIRFDPRNTACLCRGCHHYLGTHSHDHVYFFQQLKGEDYWKMRQKLNSLAKVRKNDEKEIVKHYREELERIKILRRNGTNGKIELLIPDILKESD